MPKAPTGPIGVVKGRFQTYKLHPGHEYTIQQVLELHYDVLLILGSAAECTEHDPLPFELRRMMIAKAYPKRRIVIIEEPSSPSSYEKRSEDLTRLIQSAFPGRDAVIYGARDSIVHTYRGIFPVVETKTVYEGSATLLRNSIRYENSERFRRGYIKAVLDRKPQGHPSVDVAVFRNSGSEVLTVGKHGEEGKVRFAGVLFNPEVDDSYEDAGKRCIEKEAPGIVISAPEIVGSKKIDDWRYRRSHDKIVTLLMRAEYQHGELRAGEGVDSVQWTPVHDLRGMLIDAHLPLLMMLNRIPF